MAGVTNYNDLIICMHVLINQNWLHFADFRKVGEGGFFRADSYNLWWFHNEAFLFAGHHVWILLTHYVKHSLQQLSHTTFTLYININIYIHNIFHTLAKTETTPSTHAAMT